MSKVILFLYFYLLFNLSFGQDKIVTIEHSTDLVQIGKKLSFFEDQTGSLSFNQIRQLDKEGKFNLHTKGIFCTPSICKYFLVSFSNTKLI